MRWGRVTKPAQARGSIGLLPTLHSTPPADSVRLVAVRPGAVFGSWRNIVIHVYRAAPTVDDLRMREPWFRTMVRRHPEGIGAVTVIDKDASGSLPDRHVRMISEKQLSDIAEHIKCGAVVLEGSGIQFTLLRSLLRGIAVIVRQQFPYRFFDDVSGATRWVGSHADVSPAGLTSAIEELREKLVEGR